MSLGLDSSQTGRCPAVIVLGVSRSGTSLLKQMLDHNSQLAIPAEAYFLPALWDRYQRRPKVEALLRDLMCCRRVHEWGIDFTEMRRRIPERAGFAEVIQEVYRTYAEARGKVRFGDKTPLYMQHLALLERVFPGAQYVHILRDGRDAALSYADMPYRPRFSLSYPGWLGDFAASWRREVSAARSLGGTAAAGRYFEVRYEDLVAEPEARLREVCTFLGLPFESAMLEYYRDVSVASRRNHERLTEPPSPSRRGWRKQMHAADVERFEAIAGDLLETLGYERAYPRPSSRVRTRAACDRAGSRVRLLAMRLVMPMFHCSPAWRRRELYNLRARKLASRPDYS